MRTPRSNFARAWRLFERILEEAERLEPKGWRTAITSPDGLTYAMGQWDRPLTADELEAGHWIVLDTREEAAGWVWDATVRRATSPPPVREDVDVEAEVEPSQEGL